MGRLEVRLPWMLLALGCLPEEIGVSAPLEPHPAPPPESAPDTAAAPLALPPNVLLVLADDMGVDKVSSYGAHPAPPPTPTLDALAARGVSFDRAYAYTSCSPSRSALLTGKLAHRTGLGEVIDGFDRVELPVSVPTLPRLLEGSPWSWSTGAYGKWHLSAYESTHGVDHALAVGFQDYAGSLSNLQEAWLQPQQRHDYTFFDKVEGGRVVIETTYATTDTVDDALRAIARMPEPWFVYVAFNAPHTPLHQPPPELADTRGAAGTADLVDAAIIALDAEIGRLLAAVDPHDTLVVFAGDNGTSTYGARAPVDPERVKLTAFEGGIHVPMIVAGPGVVEGGRSSALVHLVDVVPTVAELAQVDLSATGETFDGQSLWPQLTDPATPGRAMLHGDRFAPNGQGGDDLVVDWWVSHGPRFKVVRLFAGPLAVVDLQEDPDEQAPMLSIDEVPAEHRAEVQALIDAQEAFFTSIPIPHW